MSDKFDSFYNCRQVKGGKLLEGQGLSFSRETGNIVDDTEDDFCDGLDLHGAIVAPGFVELQTNGMRGFHFTHFDGEDSYAKKIDEVAEYLPSTGVTGFYATIPTVSSDDFKKVHTPSPSSQEATSLTITQILPSLFPRQIPKSASLLGAHAEGPYLSPTKKGAHNASLFHPPSTPPTQIYGPSTSSSQTLKLVTLAPELPSIAPLITSLTNTSIRVSLGHSSATHAQGLSALAAGATCLTHTLNAMAPLHHRDPGLAGLVTSIPPPSPTNPKPESPYFSLIPDGNHLHPSVATLLFRANPTKCLLITDSIELAGLPDGTYPGHAQIPFNQTKKGSRVTIEGTETLIGGCAGLDECVRNLVSWSGCNVAEAVRCVTENVVDFMGDEERGKLEVGRRADFVVLNDHGEVLQTWIGGFKVWEKDR